MGSRIAMLYSGRHHHRWARHTILAEPIGSYRFTIDREDGTDERGWPRGRSRWLGSKQDHPAAGGFTHRPFDDLRTILQRDDGIWIGYLAYDLGRWVERFPVTRNVAIDDRNWPIVDLGYCPGYLVYDLCTSQWTAHGTYTRRLPVLLDLADNHLPSRGSNNTTTSLLREHYEAAVQQTIGYISAGDVFQVNLARRLTAQLETTDPRYSRRLFEDLVELSPPWYGAYLELADRTHDNAGTDAPSPGRAIASISPELFLDVNHAHVTTRPIKGTRPAYADPCELLDSDKDAAELNMIVDLMRNDLGRVCEYGSVHVAEPRTIESHPTVHHGVATVTGRLHKSKDVVDLLRACIPGGSVTGAPKVRAMQIIDELEPVRRGPYCGCIGLVSRDRCTLNMAIRTMLIDPPAGRLDFSVGAGIVADSKPDAEFRETNDKASAMLAALTAPRQASCV